MSSLEVWIIIILVVGVIASNLAALKYSAKFKLPQFGQHDKEKQLKSDITQPPHEADGNETQTSDKSSNQSK